ncbi:MAG: hypothetical protein RIA64_01355 [Rhodospirillales bacterium]
MTDQTNPVLEKVAKAIAREKCVKDCNGNYLIHETDPSADPEAHWRADIHLARAAILAHTQALMENVSEEMRQAVAANWGNRTWREFNDVLTAHMEQMK